MTERFNGNKEKFSASERSIPYDRFLFSDIVDAKGENVEVTDISGKKALHRLGRVLVYGVSKLYKKEHPDCTYHKEVMTQEEIDNEEDHEFSPGLAGLIQEALGIHFTGSITDIKAHIKQLQAEGKTDSILRLIVTAKLHQTGFGEIGDFTGDYEIKPRRLTQREEEWLKAEDEIEPFGVDIHNPFTVNLISVSNSVSENFENARRKSYKTALGVHKRGLRYPLQGGSPGLIQQK